MGSLAQTVTAAGFRREALETAADEDQRKLQRAVNGAFPEGKEVQLTRHQSGNDLWPF